MEIPLDFKDVYEDSVIRQHLPKEIDVTMKIKEETSRGTITREQSVKRGYVEIESGRAYIELTTNNAEIIDMLANTKRFDYADEGHSKLVAAMLPGKVVEAEVVEAEVVEPEPVVEEKPEVVDEETDLSAEALEKLRMPDLRKLAAKQEVPFDISDKKSDLIKKIIEG